MMSDDNQRKIFWLLKRYSSVTYWGYVAGFQRQFLNVIERVVQNHPDNDPTPGQIEIYKRSLNDVCNLDRGLCLLASGEHSVFRRHSNESFSWNGTGYSFLMDLIYQNAYEDRPDDYIPRGQELMQLALHADLARTCGIGVLEPNSGEPAGWYPTWILSPQNLPKHPFPDPLPPVPAPTDLTVQVQTGEEVPVDGIYEPEGDGTCMNYLVGGTTAPLVTREYGDLTEESIGYGITAWLPDTEDIPTTWRLIWEDHRYEDGTIPEEEKDYFAALPESTPQEPQVKGRALPGETCTRPGYWWTPAKQGSRRKFQRGEVFPDFPYSQYGHTIWYFDRDQD